MGPENIPYYLNSQTPSQRAGLGHKADAVADDLGLRPDTVRRLIVRLGRAGAAGITPDYSRRGANQARRAEADLIAAAIAMRRQHPTWGAGIIRVILAEQHPGRVFPNSRTIQRALAEAGLNPAPAGQHRGGPGPCAERPHETWQVDAADRMKLVGAAQASWLRVVDECSGAVLETAVSPPLGPWNTVPAGETQATLRRGFVHKFDLAETVYELIAYARRRTRGFRSPIRFISRRTPTRPINSLGGIEFMCKALRRCFARRGCRNESEWTTGRRGGPEATCPPAWNSGWPGSAEELQANIDAMDRRQRESYPYHVAAHPDLEQSGRAYDQDREEECWSMDRARDLLDGYVVPRRVD